MNNLKIQISQEQVQKISDMLLNQGVPQVKINQIINGEYEAYDTEKDLQNSIGDFKKYGDVLERLSDGYTIEELQTQRISTQKIQQFQEMLQEKNLTQDNAKSLYQYSVGSNMILGVKRGKTKATIKEQIMQDLDESLQTRGISQTDIEKVKQFIENMDYKETLHSNYDRINQYMENIGIQSKARVSVRSAIQSIDRCINIDETIDSLEEGLGKTNLQKSMKLYRAVKGNYLEKRLQAGETLNSLVGKTISNNGQTSTSPLYNASFAKYDDYDTVFEIYAPKGTRGSYITELSAYDSSEQEVLLNPNDLYITNVQTGVIDKNGKTKNIIQALALSKDRECYKDIEQQRVAKKNTVLNQTSSTKIPKDNLDKKTYSENLPAKQNKFKSFLARIKSKFQRRINEIESRSKDKRPKVIKEKKSWELELKQRANIQRKTAEIAKEHREQQEKQGEELKQIINKQQPMIDIEKIEL